MHLVIFRPWATFASSRSFTQMLSIRMSWFNSDLPLSFIGAHKVLPTFPPGLSIPVLLPNLTTGSIPVTCTAHLLPGDFYSLCPLIKMSQLLYILPPIVRLIFLSPFIMLLKNLCSVFLGGVWPFSQFHSIYSSNLCCYPHFSFSQINMLLSYKIAMKYVAYMSPFSLLVSLFGYACSIRSLDLDL